MEQINNKITYISPEMYTLDWHYVISITFDNIPNNIITQYEKRQI